MDYEAAGSFSFLFLSSPLFSGSVTMTDVGSMLCVFLAAKILLCFSVCRCPFIVNRFWLGFVKESNKTGLDQDGETERVRDWNCDRLDFGYGSFWIYHYWTNK